MEKEDAFASSFSLFDAFVNLGVEKAGTAFVVKLIFYSADRLKNTDVVILPVFSFGEGEAFGMICFEALQIIGFYAFQKPILVNDIAANGIPPAFGTCLNFFNPGMMY